MQKLRLVSPFNLIIFLLLAAACSGPVPATPTPHILADTFFSGKAFIDVNNNQEIDSTDLPLAGAQYVVAGWRASTDSNGYASVVIPGGWDQPVVAHMAPPEGSDYSLIGPNEVILQNGKTTSADFLFAGPLGSPEPIVSPTAAVSPSPKTTPTTVLERTPTSSMVPSTTTITPGALSIDVTYCTTPEGVDLTMDVYQPKVLDGPSPVVMYVHGGGWTGGDKSDGSGTMFFPELQRRGYLVVSINYRLAPTYKFPAQIEDVKCVVRYLRANAAVYNLDPDRIGAMGSSAGGHLVSLLGTVTTEAEWDDGPYAGQFSRVQAVVDMFGPVDLVSMAYIRDRRLEERVFGVTDPADPLFKLYSPISHITPDDPPFLILHGDQDETVPLEQSLSFYNSLIESGVQAELVVVKNAAHGFRPLGDLDPTLEQLVQIVGDFLDRYLK